MEPVYLDHSATTPVDAEVLAAMMRYFANVFGNPSSIHRFGREARSAVDEAREKVARLLGADPDEIVFTGGGTEADNLAILGTAWAREQGKNHIVTSSIEHPAVLNACRFLEGRGFRVTCVPVDGHGLVDPDDVRKALTDQTFLVSVMHGNNETGAIEPVAAIGALARERGILLHTDAVQTAGKIPYEVSDLAVDLLSIAGHKIHAPKGVGALYVRKGTPLKAVQFGGHQEAERRAGTENVPAIVGLGKACEIAFRDMAVHLDRLGALRDRLERALLDAVEDVRVNTHPVHRLPHILNVSFRGIKGDELVRELDGRGIAVSAGAACGAGTVKISHVIEALGVPREWATGTVRFSLGKGNTGEEIGRASAAVIESVDKLRRIAELESTLGGRGCR
ncbi:MAG: cysteine desulfurase [Syntrophaceae bacterium]|nr:cysteine desulfurase [Syntrophaceae bacterium]